MQAAIERSGILERCPGLDLSVNRVGVFGRLRRLDDVAADGDRIEIYAPLAVDAKGARRRRAQGKAESTGPAPARHPEPARPNRHTT